MKKFLLNGFFINQSFYQVYIARSVKPITAILNTRFYRLVNFPRCSIDNKKTDIYNIKYL